MMSRPRIAGCVLALAVAALIPASAAADSPGFDEQFSSTTLDPAWTVVQPSRVSWSGFGPTNEYSLTANPGHLRYTLNAMTHYDGFLNGYQPAFRSCCIHDPGLELQRSLSGEHWTLESKVSYHMPFANGRSLDLRVYFGDGSEGTFYAAFQRLRDVHPFNGLCSTLNQRGASQPNDDFDRILLENPACEMLDGFGDADTTHYLRVERDAGVLTALTSLDGVSWATQWTHDLGTQLDGLDQRVVITGLSWFVPAGSYADYDYVTVTPTSPEALLGSACAELQAASEAHAGTAVGDKLEDAGAKCNEGLMKLTQAPPDRQGAAGSIEGAIGDLESAAALGLDANGFMENLAGVVRMLATDAIGEAVDRDGNEGKIAEAQALVVEGDLRAAADAFKDAAAKYKDALSKAEGA